MVQGVQPQQHDGVVPGLDLAAFDCTVHREIVAGDHTIVLLRLHALDDAGDSAPLVFHRSAFASLAEPA